MRTVSMRNPLRSSRPTTSPRTAPGAGSKASARCSASRAAAFHSSSDRDRPALPHVEIDVRPQMDQPGEEPAFRDDDAPAARLPECLPRAASG